MHSITEACLTQLEGVVDVTGCVNTDEDSYCPRSSDKSLRRIFEDLGVSGGTSAEPDMIEPIKLQLSKFFAMDWKQMKNGGVHDYTSVGHDAVVTNVISRWDRISTPNSGVTDRDWRQEDKSCLRGDLSSSWSTYKQAGSPTMQHFLLQSPHTPAQREVIGMRLQEKRSSGRYRDQNTSYLPNTLDDSAADMYPRVESPTPTPTSLLTGSPNTSDACLLTPPTFWGTPTNTVRKVERHGDSFTKFSCYSSSPKALHTLTPHPHHVTGGSVCASPDDIVKSLFRDGNIDDPTVRTEVHEGFQDATRNPFPTSTSNMALMTNSIATSHRGERNQFYECQKE
jgi:hypothetical protein